MAPRATYPYTTYFCLVDYGFRNHCGDEECVGCVLDALDRGAFHILRRRYHWHDPGMKSDRNGIFRVDISNEQVPRDKQENMVMEIVRANMIRIERIAHKVQEGLHGEEVVSPVRTLEDVKSFGPGHLYCYIPKEEPLFHKFTWTGTPETWPELTDDEM